LPTAILHKKECIDLEETLTLRIDFRLFDLLEKYGNTTTGIFRISDLEAFC
jgi:hypothetical protein